jgi:hypothetical protein
MKKLYDMKIFGYTKTWWVEVELEDEEVEAYRADGLELDEITCTMPVSDDLIEEMRDRMR